MKEEYGTLSTLYALQRTLTQTFSYLDSYIPHTLDFGVYCTAYKGLSVKSRISFTLRGLVSLLPVTEGGGQKVIGMDWVLLVYWRKSIKQMNQNIVWLNTAPIAYPSLPSKLTINHQYLPNYPTSS